MKVYAYVTHENCLRLRVFAPGERYEDIPVSKHMDLRPWYWGKRATLAMRQRPGAANQYTRRAARAVAEWKGWC